MRDSETRINNSSPGDIQRVFIGRDFSEGTGVKFSLEFPKELKTKIHEQEFRKQIEKINQIFEEAESISAPVCLENALGCLTGYFIFLCMPTHYEKCLKKVSCLVYSINKVFIKSGLLLIDPAERGLRVLEICIMERDNNC